MTGGGDAEITAIADNRCGEALDANVTKETHTSVNRHMQINCIQNAYRSE